MMSREDIRELAEFQADGADRAISFYFQPAPPSNRANRDQASLARSRKERAEWKHPD